MFLIRRTNMDRLTVKPKPIWDINESSNQHIYLLTVQKFNVFLHLCVSWFDCACGTPYTFQLKEQRSRRNFIFYIVKTVRPQRKLTNTTQCCFSMFFLFCTFERFFLNTYPYKELYVTSILKKHFNEKYIR